MNFLAPLFLAGAAALALPVVFHLIRRTARERTVFSSLMFLSPSPPRLTRRSRLEHLLLLALRCIVLCLLAFAFARPFIKKAMAEESAGPASRSVVILLDSSASMRRADLWADARSRAESVVKSASPSDQVAILAFDRSVNPVMTFAQWNETAAGQRAALASGKLAELSPGWSGTRLGSALLTAAETLADNSGKPATAAKSQEITLITDLQEGCHLEQLQGYEWPKGVRVSVEAVQARQPGNASLQLISDTDDGSKPVAATVRVRVSNSTDSKREQFRLVWGNENSRSIGVPVDIYVPPGQNRTIALPVPPAEAAADRIQLQGDAQDFDNTVYAIPPKASRFNVLYFGADTEKETRQPLFFLEHAFQETTRESVQVSSKMPDAPVAPSDLRSAALIVVTDPLPPETARTLGSEVTAGKTALLMMKNPSSAKTLAALVGLDNLDCEEAHPANYAMFSEIDFTHPLFAPFADPRFGDFTRIHFWNYRRLNASAINGARVLAKFDSGDPAVLEIARGKGRVLVFTFGWHPQDSQLALSTKFVPLLYSMLEQSGATPPAPSRYEVGDTLPLPTADSSRTIRLPDASQSTLASSATNYSNTKMPGTYIVTSGGVTTRFAVNLDPTESRTAPLPIDELERLGVPVAAQIATVSQTNARKVWLQDNALESRQKLWRWFVAATVALLLVETWLAGRTNRQQPLAQGAPS